MSFPKSGTEDAFSPEVNAEKGTDLQRGHGQGTEAICAWVTDAASPVGAQKREEAKGPPGLCPVTGVKTV